MCSSEDRRFTILPKRLNGSNSDGVYVIDANLDRDKHTLSVVLQQVKNTQHEEISACCQVDLWNLKPLENK